MRSSEPFLLSVLFVCFRYLMRTVKHPILLKDPDVLQFLESSEVPQKSLIYKKKNT